MILKTIVDNSNYITDEELTEANIVGMTNSAIAEINAKCATALPLAVEDNVTTEPYTALKNTWALRLFEPYYSFTIASNDTDTNARDFHYNRFIQAVDELKHNLSNAIVEKDSETGEDTNYAGGSENMVNIDASNYTYPWRRWF